MRVFDGTLPSENEETKTVAPEIVTVAASSTNETADANAAAAQTPELALNSKQVEELKASYEKKITALQSQLKSAVSAKKEIDDNNDDFVAEDKEELDRLRSENDSLRAELDSLRNSVQEHDEKSDEAAREISWLKDQIAELQAALKESVRFILY